MCRALLSALFPELSRICQPLAGELAAPRRVLSSLSVEPGYGVDVAVLIDAAGRCGVQAVVEVDLGARRHRNRPLRGLRPEAAAVARVILGRAGISVPARPSPPR
ncbi:MAG: hypothetical protein ACYDH5_10260 [Acidimicrobiales bacterium]